MRPNIKVTPAVVIASLALVVVAASGTAYAANSIGSADIVDGSIKSADIQDNSVGSRDITDGSLLRQDFKAGQLTTGPKGDKGDAGTTRWVLVDKDGAIVAQSGGFSITSAYGSNNAPAGAVGNVYINANEDLSDNGINASIALQNVTEQDNNANVNGRAPGSDANAEFSGEITSTVCSITGIVGCAPTGTNNRNHFVVSPRLSDGGFTTEGNRKRFYVSISGDSSDLTDAGKAIAAKELANP